jgi:hypothetical protein
LRGIVAGNPKEVRASDGRHQQRPHALAVIVAYVCRRLEIDRYIVSCRVVGKARVAGKITDGDAADVGIDLAKNTKIRRWFYSSDGS